MIEIKGRRVASVMASTRPLREDLEVFSSPKMNLGYSNILENIILKPFGNQVKIRFKDLRFIFFSNF